MPNDDSLIYTARCRAARAWTAALRDGEGVSGAAFSAATAAWFILDKGGDSDSDRSRSRSLVENATAAGAVGGWPALLTALSIPPFPLPLRGSDGGFTERSLVTRLPAILTETLSSSGASPALTASVQAFLIEPLERGMLLPPPEVDTARLWCAGADDAPIDWLWQEVCAYEHLLRLYVEHGVKDDPFSAQKARALAAAEVSFLTHVAPMSSAAHPPDLRSALAAALWGNRGDLSLSAGKVVDGAPLASAASSDDALLVDERDGALSALSQAGSFARVIIVLDNCGAELLADLVLADALLRAGVANVTLHAKIAPTFVSDATVNDVWGTIDWLCVAARTPALAARLRAAGAAGSFLVESHAFWNAPRAGWEMPSDLLASLSRAHLAIFKGDANYRRLLGDRHWPHFTPFNLVVGAYAPCPLLALRTCKAGLIVGVSPELEARARALPEGGGSDAWLVSGYFGLAQFTLPTL